MTRSNALAELRVIQQELAGAAFGARDTSRVLANRLARLAEDMNTALVALSKADQIMGLEGDAEPVAWLLVRQRTSFLTGEVQDPEPTVLSGHMFMREEAARAASLRMTNGHRLVLPMPVRPCPTLKGPTHD